MSRKGKRQTPYLLIRPDDLFEFVIGYRVWIGHDQASQVGKSLVADYAPNDISQQVHMGQMLPGRSGVEMQPYPPPGQADDGRYHSCAVGRVEHRRPQEYHPESTLQGYRLQVLLLLEFGKRI